MRTIGPITGRSPNAADGERGAADALRPLARLHHDEARHEADHDRVPERPRRRDERLADGVLGLRRRRDDRRAARVPTRSRRGRARRRKRIASRTPAPRKPPTAACPVKAVRTIERDRGRDLGRVEREDDEAAGDVEDRHERHQPLADGRDRLDAAEDDERGERRHEPRRDQVEMPNVSRTSVEIELACTVLPMPNAADRRERREDDDRAAGSACRARGRTSGRPPSCRRRWSRGTSPRAAPRRTWSRSRRRRSATSRGRHPGRPTRPRSRRRRCCRCRSVAASAVVSAPNCETSPSPSDSRCERDADRLPHVALDEAQPERQVDVRPDEQDQHRRSPHHAGDLVEQSRQLLHSVPPLAAAFRECLTTARSGARTDTASAYASGDASRARPASELQERTRDEAEGDPVGDRPGEGNADHDEVMTAPKSIPACDSTAGFTHDDAGHREEGRETSDHVPARASPRRESRPATDDHDLERPDDPTYQEAIQPVNGTTSAPRSAEPSPRA